MAVELIFETITFHGGGGTVKLWNGNSLNTNIQKFKVLERALSVSHCNVILVTLNGQYINSHCGRLCLRVYT